MKREEKLRIFLIVFFTAMIAAIVFDFVVLKHKNYFAIIIFLVSLLSVIITQVLASTSQKNMTDDIEKQLNESIIDILDKNNMGILVYDVEMKVVWLSSLFEENGMDRVGEKLLVWLPELQDLISGKAEKANVIINDDKYEVTKKDDATVLYFEDISKEYNLEKKLSNQAYVLGLINFDNFDEPSLSEDEISSINSKIKVPVLEYLKEHGVVYKTLRNNRLQLILNNQNYQKLVSDRFSILNTVRRQSKEIDVDVTLSMAFSYGSDDLEELDEDATKLLDLAETRGGDQVVVRQLGKEAVFYGGTSEARERQSKTKVRVVASTLKKLIEDADNVIVVGHKDSDADCVGSALAVSLISMLLSKEVYIAIKRNEVEKMIGDVLKKYDDVLINRHKFVSENEALSVLNDKSLVIMVDHHSMITSNSPELLKEAKNIVIIDHHRRKADLDVDAKFLYVEAGASSTTELTVELFPYFAKSIDIEREEANIMYIGLLIDTNHFRSRTDERTFDVAKTLKQYGANSIECEILIEEPYDNIKKRYEIMNEATRYKDNIMIANMKKSTYPRSVASQAVDDLVGIKEIDAAFVICKISSSEYAISARSNGRVNVQLIMEKLGGGGHMTAAGLQTKERNSDSLYIELIKGINEYLESVNENESNTTK